jgi:dephospho-CoA kinase
VTHCQSQEKDNQLDKIIVVASPVDVRIGRILKRDSFRTKEDVYEILKRQKNEKEYLEIADFIIKNDEAHLVIPQVLKIIDKLSKVK